MQIFRNKCSYNSTIAETLASQDLRHARVDATRSCGRLLRAGDVEVVLASAARCEPLERSAQVRVGVESDLELVDQHQFGSRFHLTSRVLDVDPIMIRGARRGERRYNVSRAIVRS